MSVFAPNGIQSRRPRLPLSLGQVSSLRHLPPFRDHVLQALQALPMTRPGCCDASGTTPEQGSSCEARDPHIFRNTSAAPGKYRGRDGRRRACLTPTGKRSAVAGMLLSESPPDRPAGTCSRRKAALTNTHWNRQKLPVPITADLPDHSRSVFIKLQFMTPLVKDGIKAIDHDQHAS